MDRNPAHFIKLTEYDPKVIIQRVLADAEGSKIHSRHQRRASDINLSDATEIFAWVEDVWLLLPKVDRYVDYLIWLDKLDIVKFNERLFEKYAHRSRVNNNALRVQDLIHYLVIILQARLQGVDDELINVLDI